jgi:P27 family predicted phage terminase small subunit
MSQRGVPLNLKRGHGGVKALSTPAPAAMTKPPNAPRNLGDHAQAYWRFYSRRLIDMNILYEPDLKALEDLCYWEGLKDRLRQQIDDHRTAGVVEYKDKAGRIKHTQPHAAYSMLQSAQGLVNELRKKFGLTPGDRPSIKVVRTPEMSSHTSPTKKDW